MSWHIRKAGKGIDVAAEFGKASEEAAEQTHNSPAAKEAIKRAGKLVTELVTGYPEKTVIATSTGHIEAGHASMKVELEVLY